MEVRLDGKYESNLYGPVKQVLTVTRNNKFFPVVVEYRNRDIRVYMLKGRGVAGDQLIEVCEFKRGDKVMVINNYNWMPRYFSHLEGGMYHCFWNGGTEWSSKGIGTCAWHQCRKPTLEELGEGKG